MSGRPELHETHVCRDCGAEITLPFVRVALAASEVAVLDADALYAAIIDELVVLWGEPSDGVSVQVRPIVARSIVDRYVRLHERTEP